MSGLSNAAATRSIPAEHLLFESCVCLFLILLSFFSSPLARTEIITDMLGIEKFRLSIETMLESLQDPQINK